MIFEASEFPGFFVEISVEMKPGPEANQWQSRVSRLSAETSALLELVRLGLVEVGLKLADDLENRLEFGRLREEHVGSHSLVVLPPLGQPLF